MNDEEYLYKMIQGTLYELRELSRCITEYLPIESVTDFDIGRRSGIESAIASILITLSMYEKKKKEKDEVPKSL